MQQIDRVIKLDRLLQALPLMPNGPSVKQLDVHLIAVLVVLDLLDSTAAKLLVNKALHWDHWCQASRAPREIAPHCQLVH